MSQELGVDTLKQEINSGLVELYELQVGSDVLYFHDGKNESIQNVQFRQPDSPYTLKTYLALPILMSGIEHQADGASPRPSLTVANIESILKSSSTFQTDLNITNFKLDDLVGAKLKRRRTLEKHLASNPPIEFRSDTYIIDRIEEKNNLYVSFELASAFDLDGIRLPSRILVGKYCPWKYQGASTEETDITKRRGACVWKSSGQVKNSAGATSSIFVTDEDEYLVSKTALDATSPATSISSHNTNVIVKISNEYYQSLIDSNTSAVTDTTKWRQLQVYTTWSSSSVSYAIGDFVLHSNIPWKAIRANTSSADNAPVQNSAFWEKADICGKLLESCKKRYQAIGTNSSTGTSFIPAVNLDTVKTLPFGAFPGSRKFR
jgi:lambda family phage minor tail protein L